MLELLIKWFGESNKDLYHFEEYGNIEVHCFGHRSAKLVKDIQLKKQMNYILQKFKLEKILVKKILKGLNGIGNKEENNKIAKAVNPYGDGLACERITDILEDKPYKEWRN